MSGCKQIIKVSVHGDERRFGQHRLEHWYVDNQVYFITARCRDQYPAFATDRAKEVFWDRFDHYTAAAGFVPWITTLLDNHYHTLGYNRSAQALKTMMQRLHGSVAKLTNDVLEAEAASSGRPPTPPVNERGRLREFWRDTKGREFFDGCIRDQRQARRAYRYTYLQCPRHGIGHDPSTYPHTRVNVELERAIQRAIELDAFMENVTYPRYQRRKHGH